MLAAVVGGKLQGVEATYLAQKAGWDVVVIDKEAGAPASGFCNTFIPIDTGTKESLHRAIKAVDIIIPAVENYDALVALSQEADRAGIPICLDLSAYSISSSKIRSNRFFSEIGVPVPRPWPECGFPVVAKPSDSSGSKGVHVFRSEDELTAFGEHDFDGATLVMQEFLLGPSYSLEIVGMDGSYVPIQVTDLHMDTWYDCKRVTAPTELSQELAESFADLSVELARALDLKGIMDVEVVLNKGELKVLEIDARLPSQTPTTVFWSTGLNMVEMLGNFFVGHSVQLPRAEKASGVVYEHIAVSPGLLERAGEHIMTGNGPLHVEPGFFGADEAITSYADGKDHWVATLICAETELSAAKNKMEGVIEAIRRRFRIERMVDSSPAQVW